MPGLQGAGYHTSHRKRERHGGQESFLRFLTARRLRESIVQTEGVYESWQSRVLEEQGWSSLPPVLIVLGVIHDMDGYVG